jgi:acetyl esterase
MPLDPQLAGILSLLEGAPPLRDSSAAQARANFRTMTVTLRDRATLAPVAGVEDTTFPSADGPRPARVYRPAVEGPVPTILFVHGGGFVIGDLDTHEDHARLLCAETGSVVLAIDYRLAPEHPFPAAHLDTVAALHHVFATIDALGGDATRVAVAGDSAGGNLAAGAALAARDAGLPLKAQLLLYPVTDFEDNEDHPSRVENADGYLLTADDMRWFGEQYVGTPELAGDLRSSVLRRPDLEGVAPAVVGTAEYDPLRDEGEAYAAALQAAGVPVVLRRYDGLIHGFFGLGHVSDMSQKASLELCADLKELLG